jgi:adenylosuccinate synthase
MVVLRESVRLCGLTEIALTKLDVLSGEKEVRICVAYEYKGRTLWFPPQEENSLAEVAPVYETLPGWSDDIGSAGTWEELPPVVQCYVQRLEELAGIPVAIISVGPERGQTIRRRG